MNEKFIEFMCEKVYGDENYNYTKQDYRNLLKEFPEVKKDLNKASIYYKEEVLPFQNIV